MSESWNRSPPPPNKPQSSSSVSNPNSMLRFAGGSKSLHSSLHEINTAIAIRHRVVAKKYLIFLFFDKDKKVLISLLRRFKI
jgi:hypothetical protein